MNALDDGNWSGWQHFDRTSHVDDAGRDLPAVTAKILMRPHHALHGKAEGSGGLGAGDIHVLQVLKQWRALKPRHVCAAFHHVIALQSAHGQPVNFIEGERIEKPRELTLDLKKYLFFVSNLVHLVDGNHQMGNAKQRGDVGMAVRLFLNSAPGIQ